MKNKLTRIGDWDIKVPELVVKLGLVFDSYKFSIRTVLWDEAETKAAKMMPTFSKADRFHATVGSEDGLTIETRYYTPEANRVLNPSPGETRH